MPETLGYDFHHYCLLNKLQRSPTQASGAAIPSFVGSLLDEYEQSGSLDEDDEQNIKGVAGNIYSGKYCCRSSSNTLHIIIF